MLYIIAFACQVAAPDPECRFVSLPVGAVSKRKCRFYGIKALDRWGKENKGWYVKRWDCGPKPTWLPLAEDRDA